MNKKYAIIYHDADFDGKLSNLVCRHFLTKEDGATVHSYGWDYGRPVPESRLTSRLANDPNNPALPDWWQYDKVYIVDLCIDELICQNVLRINIVWIDHHKSAIDKWKPVEATGYRIDGVAACRLCWQWFSFEKGPNGDSRTHPKDVYLPALSDFTDRNVSEPTLIRLAGEYDVWDKRDPAAEPFQYGLRTLTDEQLSELAQTQFRLGEMEAYNGEVNSLIDLGRSIQSYVEKQQDEYAAAYASTIYWNGLCLVSLNIGQRGNSSMVRAAIRPEHDGCFVWRWDGKQFYCSLYHIPGKEHVDLLSIAKVNGGGGHPGACGFRVSADYMAAILNCTSKTT